MADVEPGYETEQKIAEIMGKLLGVKQVGVHDNFFQLGGHSLLGTQLITRLGNAFGIELTIQSLFEGPTVAEIAGNR